MKANWRKQMMISALALTLSAANSMSFVYKDKTVMEYGYEVTNTKITVKPAIWVTVE